MATGEPGDAAAPPGRVDQEGLFAVSSPLSQPEVWQAVAPHYAAELVPTFEHYANEALDLAGVGAGQSVLDVACGPGTLAFLAARRGAEVMAVDFCAGMIGELAARLAETPAAIEARVADGMDLPLSRAPSTPPSPCSG